VKKACVIFLLISYTTAALGAAINFHFCGGHLAHVSILNFGGKTGCSCNPKAMPKDCCKDKLLYSKVDNHRTQQASYTINIISFTPYLPPVTNLCNFNLRANNSDSDSFYKYVRRSFPKPVYLLVGVFRI
jgi:hypothetical protein